MGTTLVVMPTIASNDSPTSELIVLYDEAHRVSGVEMLARAPPRLLAAQCYDTIFEFGAEAIPQARRLKALNDAIERVRADQCGGR